MPAARPSFHSWRAVFRQGRLSARNPFFAPARPLSLCFQKGPYMRSIRPLLTVAALLMLAACSSSNPPAQTKTEPAKAEKKEPLLYTGREAFQKMYISAHQWAADAKPYKLESVTNAESNGKDGKATVWRSGFASTSRRGIKAFLWSGSQLPEAPSSGVSSGVEDTYNPSNSATQIFDFAFLKKDS